MSDPSVRLEVSRIKDSDDLPVVSSSVVSCGYRGHQIVHLGT